MKSSESVEPPDVASPRSLDGTPRSSRVPRIVTDGVDSTTNNSTPNTPSHRDRDDESSAYPFYYYEPSV